MFCKVTMYLNDQVFPNSHVNRESEQTLTGQEEAEKHWKRVQRRTTETKLRSLSAAATQQSRQVADSLSREIQTESIGSLLTAKSLTNTGEYS